MTDLDIEEFYTTKYEERYKELNEISLMMKSCFHLLVYKIAVKMNGNRNYNNDNFVGAIVLPAIELSPQYVGRPVSPDSVRKMSGLYPSMDVNQTYYYMRNPSKESDVD